MTISNAIPFDDHTIGRIAKYLNDEDLRSCAAVCKHFNSVYKRFHRAEIEETKKQVRAFLSLPNHKHFFLEFLIIPLFLESVNERKEYHSVAHWVDDDFGHLPREDALELSIEEALISLKLLRWKEDEGALKALILQNQFTREELNEIINQANQGDTSRLITFFTELYDLSKQGVCPASFSQIYDLHQKEQEQLVQQQEKWKNKIEDAELPGKIKRLAFLASCTAFPIIHKICNGEKKQENYFLTNSCPNFISKYFQMELDTKKKQIRHWVKNNYEEIADAFVQAHENLKEEHLKEEHSLLVQYISDCKATTNALNFAKKGDFEHIKEEIQKISREENFQFGEEVQETALIAAEKGEDTIAIEMLQLLPKLDMAYNSVFEKIWKIFRQQGKKIEIVNKLASFIRDRTQAQEKFHFSYFYPYSDPRGR